ncbi:hypothetical protein [Sphingomonas xanthus]|uniref:Uncharacterized protein n=1 Tax=Sphingomonas xanthus TaxID=2594473 RepID=A0A516IU81_9SPHN|nr:hypothetical protein [Sphingomonas xanthus]QDP20453.1 hypothetical protein FMM02_11095 [Sphingomonas xanthus]
MSKVRKIATASLAAALMVSVPVASSASAVRPSSAVPTAVASSNAATAQFQQGSALTPWPAYVVMALTLSVALWIAAQKNKPGSIQLPISRG